MVAILVMMIQTLILILTTVMTIKMMTIKKSTQPDLSSRVRLQPHTTARRELKCKLCSTSRAGCQIPLMKKPL